MGIRPLKKYLDARDALAEGDPEAAAAALEEALGSAAGNPVVQANLDKLLDHDTPAGEAALQVLNAEVNKR